MESSTDPRIGTTLEDRYRITARISSGAMGDVYRGERLQLGRAVAIKFLRGSIASDAAFRERFDREARAMSRLAHPNCVSVIDFGVDDAPYLVMEFVTGIDLDSLLERGALDPKRAIKIVRQVLAGLAHAHGQGIVHRDIKAANVMLTEATGTGDHVQLLDFGLARLLDQKTTEASSQLVVGTPSYMAPEVSLAASADARSDIYSTGILLFELIAGRKPFRAEETFDLLQQHRGAPIPSLSTTCTDPVLAEQLDGILRSALAKDPDERFQSAIAFAEALDGIASGKPEPANPAEVALPFARTEAFELAPRRRRSRFLPTLALLAILIGLGYFAHARGYLPGLYPGGELAAQESTTPASSADPAPALPAYAAIESESIADAAALVAAEGPTDAGPDARVEDASVADGGVVDSPIEMVFDVTDEIDAVDENLEMPSEELDEPVAAVEDDDLQVPVEPEPTRAPRVVRDLGDVKALIAEGNRIAAIKGLQTLRRRNPKSAYLAYLLGNLQFERRYWKDGIEAYRIAIKNDRRYRRRIILNRNLIRALGSRSTYGQASWTFKKLIGRAALPQLRRAARSDKNPKVRARASALAKTLARRRR